MKDWMPLAGALVCTCMFILGEAGEIVRHGHSCWMHEMICVGQPDAPLHATDSSTINIAGPSTTA
jgi:hypothetical protein